jgi:RNA polymerase sigma-70 factor (ECF subfamily)
MNQNEWFEQIHNKYRDKIFGFVKRMVYDDAAADDVVNETFIRLFKKGMEVDEYVVKWLYRVARNLSYQYIETNVRYTCLDREKYETTVFDESVLPLENIKHGENVKDLFVCIEQLNPKHKKVIELRYFKNLPYKDIGDIMKETEGNVGFMLNAAIKKLRIHMEACLEK